MLKNKKQVGLSLLIMVLAGLVLVATANADSKSAKIRVLTPRSGDVAGVNSRGFLVDLAVRFEGDLADTGAALELTGPGAHANTGPFPGDFSAGADPSFPGLVVLLSSGKVGAGPGQNLANLFNIVAVTNRKDGETEVWATWIIGAPNLFGTVGELEESELFVAVVDGMAPNAVTDMDGDGDFDKRDLKNMGYQVISNSRTVDFVVNGFE